MVREADRMRLDHKRANRSQKGFFGCITRRIAGDATHATVRPSSQGLKVFSETCGFMPSVLVVLRFPLRQGALRPRYSGRLSWGWPLSLSPYEGLETLNPQPQTTPPQTLNPNPKPSTLTPTPQGPTLNPKPSAAETLSPEA